MWMRAFSVGCVIAMAVGLSACSDTCSSELVTSVKSIDGTREAGFFKKNCGATTGYVYEVRVNESASSVSLGNVVLRFDDNHAVEWPDDDKRIVNLSWKKNSDLQVTVAEPVRVFKEESSSNDVDVHFQYKPGTSKL